MLQNTLTGVHIADMEELLEGCYKASDTFYTILKNVNGKISVTDPSGIEYPMEAEYGDFGQSDPVVEERSGNKTYNAKFTLRFTVDNNEDKKENKDEVVVNMREFISFGVIFAKGARCYMKGFTGVSGLEKITDEELEEIMNDFDPIEAPPGPYKVQPGKKGKIIWLTGAPGMGKSTTAQLLARNHGYVYYEADCFGSLKNPYVPLDMADPTMGQMYQKILKGPGMEERLALMKKLGPVWDNLMTGKEYDKEAMLEYYRHLAADIAREKTRIGGDFAIAHVLLSAEVRAAVREVLGPDLIINVLTMNSADRRDRILARHSGDVSAADMLDEFEKLMEGVKEDEQNTIELQVNGKMTRDDVVTEILKKVG